MFWRKRKRGYELKAYCPWCGKRTIWDAGYIDCDKCEVVSEVRAVT